MSSGCGLIVVLTLCSQVKTSKVFIRDSTLIHPLILLLFAGKTLDVISSEGLGVCENECESK